MKIAPLLPLLALAGCNAATDPYAPRAGQWETQTSFVSMEGPGVTPERIAELRKAAPKPIAGQLCYDGARDKVGDTKMEGRCTVTRVSDSGATADNEWLCQSRGTDGSVTITTHGTRGPERYDYRIATSSVKRGASQPTVIVMRETARRIGDCPKP